MTTARPHSAVVHQHFQHYLDGAVAEIRTTVLAAANSHAHKAVYKNSHAAYSILKQLGQHRPQPLVRGLAANARRHSLLMACRQLSLAHVELRRAIELAAWFVYFRDHPVEWRHFVQNPGGGTAIDRERPIAFCAHRNTRWYLAYCQERFSNEETGECVAAARHLLSEYSPLSGHVHVAMASLQTTPLRAAFDTNEESAVDRFARLQKRVLSAAAVLVAGVIPGGLGKLPATERDWFDWLVGKKRAKRIRSAQFGLPT